MSFSYRNGVLHAEGVALDSIARQFGTPCYVYSRAAIESAYDEYAGVLRGTNALVCYSVKANSNLAVLSLLAQRGAGFDIVSGGELARVLAAGGAAGKTVFSGIGKSAAEIELALEKGVLCINVESEAELERVDAIAQARKVRAPIAFRVNPDIDARTHPYISTGLRENKFGVAFDDAERLYMRAARMPGIEIVGLGCHIGSQLTRSSPYIEAAGRLVALADRLQKAGLALRHLDFGGGIGIRYQEESAEPISTFLDGVLGLAAGRRETLIVDPGRSIVGNAGVIVTRIEYVKTGAARSFLVVDAAMNDLLRPALYGAWHEVRPVRQAQAGAKAAVYDVVGPVCESADFLAKERLLHAAEGDLLALMSAGAYAAAMGSNYNSRPRPAEVLVEGDRCRLVRRRETVDELFALERFPA
ncbi:MAG TPA: diaminopimelate decarboxylase [Burkholderiales bacterium]|nr:diaminopimelate decarboxylase [Burkholderiales bacterium]